MSTQKSTNVRPKSQPKIVPAWITRSFQVVQAIAPSLAVRIAHDRFIHPPGLRPLTDAESATLATARSAAVPGPDGPLWTASWGQGPRVLLVHGWGGRGGQLAPLVEPLLQAGFSVVTFDAPGHGSPSKHSSLPHFARAVRAVADAFGPIHAIVSHSMGGAAAGLAIADGLHAERAVMIAPPSDARNWFAQFRSLFGINRDVARRTQERVEKTVGMSFDRLHIGAIGADLTLPTLVIHDCDDREVPWESGATVAKSVANASLLTTNGLGHRRILHDEKVLASVVEFVDSRALHAETATGQELDARCDRCDRSLRQSFVEGPLCDQCAMEIDLFDRRQRWGRIEKPRTALPGRWLSTMPTPQA